MKNIYILYGSPSDEREISLNSKKFFYNLLKEFQPKLIEWTLKNTFIFNRKEYYLSKILQIINNNNAIVVLALHGKYGEDGYIQKILSDARIPYTGSDSISCRLSINKFKSNKAVENIVKTIPTYNTLLPNFKFNELNYKIGKEFPIFAKPNSSGSSIGVHKIQNKSDFNSILKILDFTQEYLFQPAIEGREVSLGVIKMNNLYLDLPITEIYPNSSFFDYNAKYTNGGAKEITPAKISKDLTNNIKSLSKQIHDRLGLGFYSRTDFIISNNNKIYYLETNSLPGMSETSILPQQLILSKNLEIFKKGLLEYVIK